ncbi:endonuclease/exonuclease/phosphatase family protein [Patulibacter defluvii]|uniref:endonuclease/exonuclease/phosphatase family protein n=1 Tax=Patulibacter defluvii TaxID=3095358 RepID=UPI002A75EF72|nr:endonuclease/exonuclease/phosphatase family protein [Patulibacter sp. DM4]
MHRRSRRWTIARTIGAATVALAATAGSAAAAAPAAPPVQRIVTANVDFTSSPAGERSQVAHVLATRPGIVLLQEVRELRLAAPGGPVPRLDKYGIVQFWRAGPFKRASAILFKKPRFRLVDKGLAVGYEGRGRVDPPARYLPWAVLEERRTGRRLAVISVHMPKASLSNAFHRDAYKAMIGHYQQLVTGFRNGRRIPVIAGGDWNQDLSDRNPVAWGAITGNHRAGLRTNWELGRPCPSTIASGGRFDGFGLRTGPVTLLQQGCLAAHTSDHRPVWMTVQLTGGAA